MYSLFLGSKEILADLIQNLSQSSFTQLNLIVIVDHSGSYQGTLIDIDHSSHDVSVVSDARFNADVLLVTRHKKAFGVSKLLNG